MSMYEHNEPLFDALFSTACHMKGIIPIRYGEELRNAAKDMAAMSPEEARTSKRKFRKAWRKLAKASLRGKSRSDSYARGHLGLGKTDPSRNMKRARKVAVMGAVRREATVAKERLLNPQ